MAVHALGHLLVLLLLAAAVGRLMPRGAPYLAGYLMVGALLGPTGLRLVTRPEFVELRPLTQFAMGLLMVLIGQRIARRTLRQIRRVAHVSLASYAVTSTAVFLVLYLVGASMPLAIVLGVLAGGGAPVTVAAIAGSKTAANDYAERLIGLHMGVDVLTAVTFAVAFPFALAAAGSANTKASIAVEVVRISVAGIAVGAASGMALQWATRRFGIPRSGFAVAVFALAGLAACAHLGLSMPLCGLVFGVATVTGDGAATISRGAPTALGRAAPALYLLFFTLSGAAIRLDALLDVGFFGAVYITVRLAAKFAVGTTAGLLRGGSRFDAIRLGGDSIPQAGVALGLATLASASIPGRGIATVTIGSIVIFELLGATIVSRSLTRGEGRPERRTAQILVEDAA